MALKVHNSLTRRREEFQPLNPPRVTMYVCGPTVYGHSHLGHAKSYVSFDAIVRWLRFRGYEVYYVQNITDVGHLTDDADEGEDKIIEEARRRGLHPMAIVETFLRSYLDDMDALNVLRPDIMPRATGHVPEQIQQVQALLERGHAYEANGSVYFDVHSDDDYGKLSGRSIGELEAGARVEVNSEKRHPADFALWKKAEPGHIMRWPSPWGEGFPGWHLECSVMSAKYLGETFDIHGGGLENQFPHHECEIAQHECATGRPFARYWLHNNMCTLNGQKMGKSLGNAINLKQMFREGHRLLEKTFEPVVVRHFILTSHYRQTLDFSNEALKAAESGSYKLRDATRELAAAAAEAARRAGLAADVAPEQLPAGSVAGEASLAAGAALPTSIPIVGDVAVPAGGAARSGGANEHGESAWSVARFAKSDAIRNALGEIERRFGEAMDEDFNTAAAIASLFDLARQSGGWIREGAAANAPVEDLVAARALAQRLTGDALGLKWEQAETAGASTGKTDDLMGLLIELRNDARKSKNFAVSDQIRDRLKQIGVELRDGPEGTTWSAQ